MSGTVVRVARVPPSFSSCSAMYVATNGALLARATTVRCFGELPWLPDACELLGALRTGDAGARVRLAALGGEVDTLSRYI